MRHHLLLLLPLAAPLAAHAEVLDCLFFDGMENPGTTDAAALAALRVHNCARKTVSPIATPPIQPLIWSTTVANQAAVLANACVFQHGDVNGYGQNIYAAAGGSPPSLSDAATDWASEFANYNYAANTCAAGETCGHYTQIVWSNTQQLGCALTNCTSNSPFGSSYPSWTFIVCDYSPPGNYIGQRPY